MIEESDLRSAFFALFLIYCVTIKKIDGVVSVLECNNTFSSEMMVVVPHVVLHLLQQTDHNSSSSPQCLFLL